MGERGRIQAGTYGGSTVTWSTSKIPESKKEKNYAKRILSNAKGKTNYKDYLGVAIPENPSEGDINRARGILGMKLLDEKASGGIVGEGAMSSKTQKEPKKKKIPQYYKGGGKVKKNYAYGGRVAKYKG